MFFIRVSSVIRADGAPSAQVRSLQLEVSSCIRLIDTRPWRALRANRVFGTDEKRIRTKYTVMDKIKGSTGGVFKIGNVRRQFFVRAKS